MFKTGLVSVSFRDKSPEEIIDAAVESRLNGIEWSGAHIPTGDIEAATQIKYLCDKNGLQIFSYGSYFRLGVNETADFEAEVSVAAALGAKFLRIWCYDKGSNDIGNSTFDELVSQAQAVCRIARTHDITVTLECHHSTLTDDYKTTLSFLHQVNEENLKMYWQPNQFKDDNYNLLAAHALSDFTVCLHVFCWDSESRYPLKNGFKLWSEYLKAFSGEQPLLLEFMPDDKLQTLPQEAKTLEKLTEPEKGIYRHFKGNMYELIAVAKHSETLESMVVYRALYGDCGIWVRPLSMWDETVEHEGKRVKRFQRIDKEPTYIISD